jgi:hypothetical protein
MESGVISLICPNQRILPPRRQDCREFTVRISFFLEFLSRPLFFPLCELGVLAVNFFDMYHHPEIHHEPQRKLREPTKKGPGPFQVTGPLVACFWDRFAERLDSAPSPVTDRVDPGKPPEPSIGAKPA